MPKLKTRARARVFSPARRDDIDGEVRVNSISTVRHGNATEPGWGWVSFERAGFDLTFQMRLAQLRQLHEKLGEVIAAVQTVKDCDQPNCYSCERARARAKAGGGTQ